MKQIITMLTIAIAMCAGSQKAMGSSVIDKYIPFLSCFSDSTYYAIDTISGHEVLLISREIFHNSAADETTEQAISAQLYTLDTKGKIICLGEARSQGTLYPLALSDGTLLTAGHHFVTRYSIDGQPGSLSITESADETFNKKGKATYTYDNRVTNEYSHPRNSDKLTALFTEVCKARPVIFHQYVVSADPADIKSSFVRPLPSGIDINNMKDATVSASFSTKDFSRVGGSLTMTVYAEQIYDTVDLHLLQVGDSILYSGDTIVVNKKEEKNGELLINDGFDSNGITLWPYEGGTYRAVQYDDHSVYVKIGKAELPLSDNFTIVDCHEDPQTPPTTIRKNQRLYLEKLKSSRKEFSYLDTRVLIENGVITNITRHWIP